MELGSKVSTRPTASFRIMRQGADLIALSRQPLHVITE
jgi:hypothetical protein